MRRDIVRQVVDSSGTRWMVFEVHTTANQQMGGEPLRIRDSYLCFFTVTERRRLEPIPPMWDQSDEGGLLLLLSGATRAAQRSA
ncbi:MAG: hypothetical protein ABJE47_24930 [bacterium]